MTTWTVEQLESHFGHQEFKGSDLVGFLHLKSYHGAGAIIKSLNKRNKIVQTAHGYQFTNGNKSSAPIVEQPSAMPITSAMVIKINGYYIAPGAILLVDTLQSGKVVIHTSILEIDGETKHPRNKKLIFTQQHAPEEYQAVMAWLRENSGTPQVCQSEDTQVALQLAEEATAKLAAAEKEIEQLKAKFRALLD